MKAESPEIKVFEDRTVSGEWRVEYFDDDGGCYVAIFAGPAAEQRAGDYRDALVPSLRFPPPWAVDASTPASS